jgi:hypothetical protein
LAKCSIAKLSLAVKRSDEVVEGKFTILQLIQRAGLRYNPDEDYIIEINGDVETVSNWMDIASPTQEVEDDASYLIFPKSALAKKG